MRVGLIGLAALALAALFSAHEARAAAPAGRYVVTEETVFDRATGLLWQRKDSPPRRQLDAATHCQQLTLGGQSGWRLPTIKELQSLFDVRSPPPSLDPVFQPSLQWTFWSASNSESSRFWLFDYESGRWQDQGYFNSHGVRCVR